MKIKRTMKWLAIILALVLPVGIWAQSSNPSNPTLAKFYADVAGVGFNQAVANLAYTVGQLVNVTGDGGIYCSQYTTLNLCYAALPSTGGKMILPETTTISQASTLTISNPNVTIECPSWATIIQRASTLTSGQVILTTGDGDVIRGCTIDGNNVSNGSADLQIASTNGLADHIKVINGAGTIQVALSGANARLTGSTVTGTSPNANVYGVWAIQGATVKIDHNTVSNTGIDAIGANGAGTQIVTNHVFNSHCYTSTGGGQIAAYAGNALFTTNATWAGGNATITTSTPHGIAVGATILVTGFTPTGYNGTYTTITGTTGNTVVYTVSNPGAESVLGRLININANDGILVADNTIEEGCSNVSGGIEVSANNATVIGNTIDYQQWNAMSTDPGTTGNSFVSNTVKNPCFTNQSSPCSAFESSSGSVAFLTVSNNNFSDDQGVPKMQWGINILGTGDNIVVTGNKINGAVVANMADSSSGLNKTYANNLGIDNVIPSVSSAATLVLPLNPTVALTGTTTVTNLAGTICWTGRVIQLLSASAVPFTATNNIANALTLTAGGANTATCDGTNWHLK